MAIYRLSASMISRGTGRSAVAAAAYRSGGVLREGRSVVAAASYRAGSEVQAKAGRVHDYTRKGGVEFAEVMLPKGAPDWMADREQLWNAVEIAEKRKDAQLAREIQVAFPRELSMEENEQLLRSFVRREFVERGMVADACIHNPKGKDGQPNPHAHVMLTTRVLTDEGFGRKERGWNKTDLLRDWRQAWAIAANEALERAGYAERVDHRSYKDQGIDREPEPKLGPNVYKIEAEERRQAANENRPPRSREELTERGRLWVEVKQRNSLRERVEQELMRLKVSIIERQRVFVEEGRRKLAMLSERLNSAYRLIIDRGAKEARHTEDEGRLVVGGSSQGEVKSDNERQKSQVDKDVLLGRDRTEVLPEKEAASHKDRLLGRHKGGAGDSKRGELDREHLLGKGGVIRREVKKDRGDDERER